MEPPTWLTAHEEDAWRSLQEMQLRLSGQLARRLSAQSGLSYPDYEVLVALSSAPDSELRLFELGERLGWEKSRLSHHVTRMANRDLVAKKKCDEDQRGWTVVMTEYGRGEIADAAPGHVEAVRELFIRHLSRDQLAVIADASKTVLQALPTQQ